MRQLFQLIYHLERSTFLGKTVNCSYQQERLRHRPTKLDKVPVEESKCLEPEPPKRSIWNIFKKKPRVKVVEQKKHVKECETVPRPVPEEQIECELPYLSKKMGGTAYRTCGPAYIVQKDHVDQMETKKKEPEQEILEEMVKDPSLKGQCDPMPPFESVEKRLVDMCEKKLHPLYKMMMTIPKRPPPPKPVNPHTKPGYKMRSGPILPDEIPDHLKINREMFDKKNMLFEFKKALPPQQMLSRLAEIKKNEKPTMQKKIDAKKAAKECSK